MTLNEYFKMAKENKTAIGHFNFSTEDVLKAIASAAKEAGASCVMVGTSESEADFIGLKEAVAMAKAVEDDIQFPVFLNADHFKSFEKCKEAIDAGYGSVLIDGSKMSFAENTAVTKKVVEYAKTINSDISVEGELGYLKGGSLIQSKMEISPSDYTKTEEARIFCQETGINRLAVVFGNIHGIVTEQKEKLDIEHLMKIRLAVPDMFLVLHGASGLSDGDIKESIENGITNVHFNTELRVAYSEALREQLSQNPDETTPYKYLAPAAQEVKDLVIKKLALMA
ncbi:MAG: Ketose-bisphosphate aldolase, class-II [Candidatus Yanofskybacteria bacterium GW2011_GWA1_44_21]|uniref:Tagatose-bisphosphate aldolase n=2 Tax=Candidatus Yanofskyibacteriota TaxID=1752733 RepID=A0A1F8GZ79_9BACT|nr:MAG: Ketose-bisphosphate aldolase, class-II [Candidatus Yanofskybacteria bacterium GW2011_GWA2_44_10]KKT50577.1 MAG: Ketose-bisphosphate aldolase, class-II [Candidatus Yanofskybacteria bacterium GW2011_GWA1_44_21]KKT89933.1 MAG: Ketose-bisphosphate aldolase, class-II [Candidatus Yanofskybacteria bacterium GW2011_GWB1_45_11]OGN02759.1 MAG: hypothetical protein A2657_01280 [Candidatus Yanofskybacteria bacterium RIFCSPHIGHO2_01_FULL_44_110b]OGN14632.1 MAG: hypothetical protein A3C01_03025 [Cand